VGDQSERVLVIRCQEEQLVCVLHPPRVPADLPGVLVIVGGPQYRVGSHRQFVLMARALARAGYPVLRFDYRGMGDSSGDMRTFEQASEDIRAALDCFTRAMPGMPGVVLWGLCDAASAVAMHGAADSRVCGLVLVNPWVRTAAGQAKAYVTQYYGRRFLQRSFWRKLLTGGLDVSKAVRDLLSTLRTAQGSAPRAQSEPAAADFIARMLRGMQRFSGPVLVLISEQDLTAAEFTTLCRDDAAWRKVVAQGHVQTTTLAGADHTFSSRRDLDAATERAVTWLREAVSPVTSRRIASSR
jgi:uncharacterized protein